MPHFRSSRLFDNSLSSIKYTRTRINMRYIHYLLLAIGLPAITAIAPASETNDMKDQLHENTITSFAMDDFATKTPPQSVTDAPAALMRRDTSGVLPPQTTDSLTDTDVPSGSTSESTTVTSTSTSTMTVTPTNTVTISTSSTRTPSAMPGHGTRIGISG
ncbi:hypothetical protein F5Y15DRAFT_137799 [Xylariaceae sp. FL0016]|nr:hypothetical protein F5Y15DRAFT_137799 [Xylariaceae sp. FL0016]